MWALIKPALNNILIFMLLAVGSNSVMADWIAVTESDEQTLTAYVDPKTIKLDGDKAKVWILIDFKNQQKIILDGSLYLSMRVFVEFDCKEHSYRSLSVHVLTKNMGKGNPAAKPVNPKHVEWKPIAPESIHASVKNYICGTIDWSKVSVGANGVLYLNPSMTHEKNGFVRIVVLVDFSKPTDPITAEQSNIGNALSLVETSLYDCNQVKIRSLSIYWYSKNMGMGDLVLSHKEPGEWYPLSASSTSKKLFDLACEKNGKLNNK